MAVSSINTQKTIQQIIDESAKSTSNRKTGELGKDDFLSLLVTQLRYQDPMKPTEDKEFIGQMAQFSSLEQMQNMNSGFSSVKAMNLVGKYVTATIEDASSNQMKTIDGEVTAVRIAKDKTYVIVKDQEVPIDQVTEVTEGQAGRNSNISTYTNLIGFECRGAVYSTSTGDIVPVNGTVKEIQKGYYEDYAVMDGVSVHISGITGVLTTDPSYKKNYLESHIGETVEVNVVNPSTLKEVPISAVLREYKIAPDGTTTAILDKLDVPVESISNIKPVEQQKAGE
ncbi:flagellar hook capping FlgD N-terminal domain-containing protein [Pseudobacteroides cellulosolvens]|uniref:Basal-body rod modification protein FlgD n=1 Tax=Pseudobacteroides cellulosolvens ATCC 35603 = DSM 2933 TaxID=398512 RepID=A0A0L6JSI7_9FIRM|nr:flagellar hook capping FlgD N-terminal domain-containing protein [Pseudobacteroides cellulosolvens]KNY28377.1 flagellar hook capping protein [Pseudobacteroides cellulosolvens ATCC 35603 = DSM 2933]